MRCRFTSDCSGSRRQKRAICLQTWAPRRMARTADSIEMKRRRRCGPAAASASAEQEGDESAGAVQDGGEGPPYALLQGVCEGLSGSPPKELTTTVRCAATQCSCARTTSRGRSTTYTFCMHVPRQVALQPRAMVQRCAHGGTSTVCASEAMCARVKRCASEAMCARVTRALRLQAGPCRNDPPREGLLHCARRP
jgi:hypothetical protein